MIQLYFNFISTLNSFGRLQILAVSESLNIRRIDYEAAKYMRLLSTLPSSIDSTELGIPEADLLLILLRNLPDNVRSYCLPRVRRDIPCLSPSGEKLGREAKIVWGWEVWFCEASF